MATITLYNGTNMTLTGMIDYIASNKEHNNLVLDYYAKVQTHLEQQEICLTSKNIIIKLVVMNTYKWFYR